MIKNIGIEMPQESFLAIKHGKLVGLFTTYSDKGLPNLMPISTLYPKNRESVIIAIPSDSDAYRNMVWQKKVILSFVEPYPLNMHIIGRAGVLRAPSQVHPMMHIAQIDLIDIVFDDSLIVAIENGIRWKHISNETKALHDAIMAELYECAETL
jgi:hypothetical protein